MIDPIRDPANNRRQYGDSTKINARARMHERYATVDWFAFVAGHLDVPDGANVLDVGCGPGWFWSHRTHGARPDVTLVLSDLSPGMVDEATARVRADGRFGTVKGFVADAADLSSVPHAPFDTVVAMHMLYHVSDPSIVFDQVARLAKPGAQVLVSTTHPDSFRELGRISAAVWGTDERDPAGMAFPPERSLALMRKRFEDVELHESVDVLRCSNEEDARDFLLSFPPGDNATPQEIARLERCVADAFTHGVLEIRKRAAVVTARWPGAPAR